MSRASLAGPACRRSFLALLLAVLMVLACGDRLFADPLQITLVGDLAGAPVTVTYNDSQTNFTAYGFAGQMLFQPSTGSDFVGFCVDLPHGIPSGAYYVNPYSTDSPTNGLTNGGQIAYLVNTYGGIPSLSNVQAAGLQIAIWSELYDGGATGDPNNGFTSGIFQYTSTENPGDPNFTAIVAAANGYLTAANGNSSYAIWYDASPNGTGPDRGQSVIDPMPAPPAAVLFLMGLGFMGIASGWRRRLVLV